MNRRLGRVGLELGTAVHSASGSGMFSSSTYVDNAMNRRLGRVGLPKGSAVESASGTLCSSSSKTYVDNAYNRRIGRVGMEHGTAVGKFMNSQAPIAKRTILYTRVSACMSDRETAF